MKLAALYNTWGDVDLLKISINHIRPLVDIVIVVFSKKSNFGEYDPGPDGSAEEWPIKDVPIYFRQMEPDLKKDARTNETAKRNYALDIARDFSCTHFITMDADEFYDPIEFTTQKQRFHVEPNLQGLVCQCQTLFAKPTLTIGLDVTLVPFIHKLTPTIKHEFNRSYPFAWIDGQIRIDPTRSLNINSGVERIDMAMVHASWIRKDYQKKIRNSTAKANLERSTILYDLRFAAPGVFCQFYQKTLTECEDKFGLAVL